VKDDWVWECWDICTGKGLAQAIFEPNLFPYKYSNILKSSNSSYLTAYEDEIKCSKTSAYKIQTPGNYSEENIQQMCLSLVYIV